MEHPYRVNGAPVSGGAVALAPVVRSSLAALRDSLDEVDFGVVLLNSGLHATFVNRAFRNLWHLSDADCEPLPAFAELMRRGHAALGHSVTKEEFDSHVDMTIARVDSGNSTPADLRLPHGDVLRFQCIALPCGGRMLSYVRVTDIVRHSDELEVLRNAIDNVEQGIVLISEALLVQFVNKKARSFWDLTPELCQSGLTVAEYINHVRSAGLYAVPVDELDDYVIKRVMTIKSGDPTPFDIPVKDGRTIRAQCAGLLGGGRMLTYTDVTDLVQRAEHQELLAITDALTGLCNRRHFLTLANAELQRFRRYQQSFTLLYFDIDNFKTINDRFGHDAGDRAIIHMAQVCNRAKRTIDLVARLGGDEFVVLLPQSDREVAVTFSKRLNAAMNAEPLTIDGGRAKLTISIGVAEAEPGLTDVSQLLRIADGRLYRAKRAGRNCVVWRDEDEPQLA